MGAFLQENIAPKRMICAQSAIKSTPQPPRGFALPLCEMPARTGKYRPRRSVQIFLLYITVFPRCVRRFRSGNWKESAVQKRLTIPLDRQPFFIHL